MAKFLLINLCLSICAFSASAVAHPGHEDLAAHLKFADGAIHAHVKWQTPPPKLGAEQTLIVEFKRKADHTPIEAPGKVSVQLKKDKDDPKATGSVAPLSGPDGKPVTGGFVVSGIKFPSTGKWTVLISVTDAKAKVETESFEAEVKK